MTAIYIFAGQLIIFTPEYIQLQLNSNYILNSLRCVSDNMCLYRFWVVVISMFFSKATHVIIGQDGKCLNKAFGGYIFLCCLSNKANYKVLLQCLLN